MRNIIRKLMVWSLVFGMAFAPALTSLDLVMVNAEEMTETEKAQEAVSTAEQTANDAQALIGGTADAAVTVVDDAVKADTDELNEFKDEAAQLINYDDAASAEITETSENISDLNDNVDSAVGSEKEIVAQAKEADSQANKTSDAVKALDKINENVESKLDGANTNTDAATTIEELEQIKSEADAVMEEAKDKFEETQGVYDEAKQKYEAALEELDKAEQAFDEAVSEAKSNKDKAEANLKDAEADLEEAKKVANELAEKEAKAKEEAEAAELQFIAAEKEAKDAAEKEAKAVKDEADTALSEAQEIIGAADLSGTNTEIVVAIAKYYYTYIYEKEEGVTVTVRAQNTLDNPKSKDFNKNNIKVEFSDGTSLEIAGVIAIVDGKTSFGICTHKVDNFDKNGSDGWTCSDADLADAISKIDIKALEKAKKDADDAYEKAAAEKEEADNEVSEAIKAAKEELAAKQEKYSKLSEDVAAAQKSLKDASEKVDELKDQISQIKLDNLLSTNIAEIAMNNKKIAELKKAVEDAENDKKAAEEKYDELVSEKEELDEKIQDKIKSIEEASKKPGGGNENPVNPAEPDEGKPSGGSSSSMGDTPYTGSEISAAPASGVAGARVTRSVSAKRNTGNTVDADVANDNGFTGGEGTIIEDEELPGAKMPEVKAPEKAVTIEEEGLPSAKSVPERKHFPWWLLILLALILGHMAYKYYEKREEKKEGQNIEQ